MNLPKETRWEKGDMVILLVIEEVLKGSKVVSKRFEVWKVEVRKGFLETV